MFTGTPRKFTDSKKLVNHSGKVQKPARREFLSWYDRCIYIHIDGRLGAVSRKIKELRRSDPAIREFISGLLFAGE